MRRLTVMLALAIAVATAGMDAQKAQKPVKPKAPKGSRRCSTART